MIMLNLQIILAIKTHFILHVLPQELLFGLVVKGNMPFTSATINSPLCCQVTAVSEVKLS